VKHTAPRSYKKAHKGKNTVKEHAEVPVDKKHKKGWAANEKTHAEDTTAVGEGSVDNPLNEPLKLPPSYPTGAPRMIVDDKPGPNIELKKDEGNKDSSSSSSGNSTNST